MDVPDRLELAKAGELAGEAGSASDLGVPIDCVAVGHGGAEIGESPCTGGGHGYLDRARG